MKKVVPMSYSQNNVEDAESSDARTYSGEAFDRFVQESQSYINELTAENAGLKEQLEQEKKARLESEDSVDNSVRILSTAERVAAEYMVEIRQQAQKELQEAHEYSQNAYNDADAYSETTREEADVYHASIVARAQDDLATIVSKVNAKINTYKEVTERLEAFHTMSLASLSGPLEDVVILQDEVEEPVPSEAPQDKAAAKILEDVYDGHASENSGNNESHEAPETSLEDALNNASIVAVTEEDEEIAEAVEALDTEDTDIPGFDAVEPAWDADEDSDVAENIVAEQTENVNDQEADLARSMQEETETKTAVSEKVDFVDYDEIGILELDFEDADESEVKSEENPKEENLKGQNNESYLELDLSNVDDEEGK